MPNTFVVDVDGTLCGPVGKDRDYSQCQPRQDVIDKVNDLWLTGHNIILFSSRGMRTYDGDMVAIEKNIRPTMEAWLNRNGVKYHALVLGKPWGPGVKYVDDNAMHIDEFLEYKL